MTGPLPRFVSFGEALTDLVHEGAGHWRSHNGGAPWNVARSMSQLGVASAFAGGISRCPLGDSLLAASRDARLDERFIQRVADHPPLLALVHQIDPPTYLFIGNDSADLHFDPMLLPAGWRNSVQWAHFGGISLAREPLAGRLLDLAGQLKHAGTRISYDPNHRSLMDIGYDDTLRRLCAMADVVKVSDDDLRGLFRCSDTAPGVARLRSWLGPDALLLLTRGAAAATLFAGACQWQALPPQVSFVDSIGAGDASMAGLLHSLIARPQAEPAEHLRRAVAAGAAACALAGAAAVTEQQVARVAPSVTVY